MYMAVFKHYEECCVAVHSSKEAINLLIEIVEDIGTWDLFFVADVNEDTFKLGDAYINFAYSDLGLISELEDDLNRQSDENSRIVNLKLLEHYKNIENKYKDIDLTKFKRD